MCVRKMPRRAEGIFSFTACGAPCVTFEVGFDFKKLDHWIYSVLMWKKCQLLTGNMVDKGFRVKDLHMCVTFMHERAGCVLEFQYPSHKRSSFQWLHGSLFMYTHTGVFAASRWEETSSGTKHSFSPSIRHPVQVKVWINRSGVELPPMCSLGLQEN